MKKYALLQEDDIHLFVQAADKSEAVQKAANRFEVTAEMIYGSYTIIDVTGVEVLP